MKIAVWRTGHEIADTVAEAVATGLVDNGKTRYISYASTDRLDLVPHADIHIGYGILRGMDEVFHACDKSGKPWFNIDKGYWKPGHYDGYYRVSLRGTQQTTGFDKLDPDYVRWDALGIEILPSVDRIGRALLCPETEHIKKFFDLGYMTVITEPYKILLRKKDCQRLLQDDLNACSSVYTFNSSVGWEALRQGIPVVSDQNHSIIGAYVNHFEKSNDISFASRIHKDVNMRRRLFAVMAGLQLTLEEMRQGKLWPLMQNLLSCTSDLTPAKL